MDDGAFIWPNLMICFVTSFGSALTGLENLGRWTIGDGKERSDVSTHVKEDLACLHTHPLVSKVLEQLAFRRARSLDQSVGKDEVLEMIAEVIFELTPVPLSQRRCGSRVVRETLKYLVTNKVGDFEFDASAVETVEYMMRIVVVAQRYADELDPIEHGVEEGLQVIEFGLIRSLERQSTAPLSCLL